MKKADHSPSRRRTEQLLLPFEAACLVLIVAIGAITALLASMREVAIDWASFLPIVIAMAMLGAIAIGYRWSGRSANIPLTLMAALIYVLYSNAGAILQYLLVPVGSPTIDAELIAWDRMLGFDWGRAAAFVLSWPMVSQALALTYSSSLVQLAAIVLLLGLTGRQRNLHRFLACGILASMFCILFWSVLPSIGPAAWIELPQDAQRAPRVVDSAYAAAMHDLLANGPSQISARAMLGLVAMPSLHTVMMLMCVWYVRGSRVFPLFFAINLPMLPAILVHGGHHLVDVLAGIVLFLAVAWLVARLVQPATGLPAASSTPLGAAGSSGWRRYCRRS